MALGATRFDVLRQLWTENLALALAGAATGLFLALLLLDGLRGFLPAWMIPMGGFSLSGRVLAFTFGTALITSLLFGALPAASICAQHSLPAARLDQAHPSAPVNGSSARRWRSRLFC
jgi:ABC-type antimicrobial peptide transport system permease subunit